MFALIGWFVDLIIFLVIYRSITVWIKRIKDSVSNKEKPASSGQKTAKKKWNKGSLFEEILVDSNLSPRLQQDMRQRQALKKRQVSKKQVEAQPTGNEASQTSTSVLVESGEPVPSQMTVDKPSDKVNTQKTREVKNNKFLKSPQDLRQAIILKEILDQPLALRDRI